ncbi:MAG: hypothetical protein GF416_01205 [Candidatus Altiarchaeales archaeon]|nr:hypothetical protein [Candidatus Altiarchaeales archaeon]MBD3415734.1 hypothetical protein [Candidatus Altiarchaeales archaeon]
MPVDLPGIDIKEYGEFKAMETMGNALDLVVSKKIDTNQAYNLISVDLDELACITRVSPQKLLQVLLREEKYNALFEGMRSLLNQSYAGEVEPDVLESLVRSTFILDRLKALAKESGKPHRTLSFLASKFNVEEEAIALVSPGTEFVAEVMDRPEKIIEALRLTHKTFGMESSDIYSVAMVATTGMLVGVRDFEGRLAGVGEFICDRNDKFNVYRLCVSKGFEGHRISETIFRKAVELHPGRTFWLTASVDASEQLMMYYDNGFKIARLLKDYLGRGVHQLYLERKPGQEILMGGLEVEASFNPDRGSYLMDASADLDFEDVLNNHGFTLVQWDVVGERMWVLERGDLPATESRRIKLPKPFGNLHFAIAESPLDLEATCLAEREMWGAKALKENAVYHIGHSGMILLAKDGNGDIAADSPLVFDVEGGIYSHGIGVKDGLDKIEVTDAVMACIEDIARQLGKTTVWTTAETDNLQCVLVTLNRRGYSGRKIYLKYYGVGENRMVISKDLAGEPAEEPEWIGSPLIREYREFKDKQSLLDTFMVSSQDYTLIAKILESGYRVSYAVTPEKYLEHYGSTVNHPLCVLVRD